MDQFHRPTPRASAQRGLALELKGFSANSPCREPMAWAWTSSTSTMALRFPFIEFTKGWELALSDWTYQEKKYRMGKTRMNITWGVISFHIGPTFSWHTKITCTAFWPKSSALSKLSSPLCHDFSPYLMFVYLRLLSRLSKSTKDTPGISLEDKDAMRVQFLPLLLSSMPTLRAPSP